MAVDEQKQLGLKWIELLNSSSLAKPFRSYVESRYLELHPLHWGSPLTFRGNPSYIIRNWWWKMRKDAKGTSLEVVTPRTARSPFQISDTLGAQGAEMEACNASAGSILSFGSWMILDALGIWRNFLISRIDSESVWLTALFNPKKKSKNV